MKKLKLLILFLFVTASSLAQSTEIRPGLILPQMTTAERVVAVPPDGVLVFDSNTQSYWFRQSGSWVELPKGGSTSNYWQLNGLGGNEIMNTNSGGIWSANPTALNYLSNTPVTAPVSGPGTRLMWIPSRSALRVGTVDGTEWDAAKIGLFSAAIGYNSEASNSYSTAIGRNAEASSYSSIAIGTNTTASGNYSTAMGSGTEASGQESTSMGTNTEAIGDYSTAMGMDTDAIGNYSTAVGFNTTASGEYSTAIGYETTGSGLYSSSMGSYTTAGGESSIAMGQSTIASGDYSTAIGKDVEVTGNGSIFIGDSNPGTDPISTRGVSDRFYSRFKNGYYFLTSESGSPDLGAYLAHNQTAWSSISDSTKKENFIPADGDVFLEKLKGLKLGSWNYKSEEQNPERFYGPMAQEIYAAYGKDAKGTIGSDTLVSTLNMDGLLFIFAQELEKRTANLKEENNALKSEIDALKEKYDQNVVANKSLKSDFEQRISQIEKLLTAKSKGDLAKHP